MCWLRSMHKIIVATSGTSRWRKANCERWIGILRFIRRRHRGPGGEDFRDLPEVIRSVSPHHNQSQNGARGDLRDPGTSEPDDTDALLAQYQVGQDYTTSIPSSDLDKTELSSTDGDWGTDQAKPSRCAQKLEFTFLSSGAF